MPISIVFSLQHIVIGGLPDAALELRFVYGYRGWDCRNNIGFADYTREIVYHIGGVGIVFDTENNTQTLNTDHSGDIISIAVHPLGHIGIPNEYKETTYY